MVYLGPVPPYLDWSAFRGHTLYYSLLEEVAYLHNPCPSYDSKVACLSNNWTDLIVALGDQAREGRDAAGDAGIERGLLSIARVCAELIAERGLSAIPGAVTKPSVFPASGSFEGTVRCVLETAAGICSAKNQDYAAGDDPLQNFRGCEQFGVSAHLGATARMSDKQARLRSLGFFARKERAARVSGETTADTLIDLLNYCLLTAVLRRESARYHVWPLRLLARLATKYLPVRVAA